MKIDLRFTLDSENEEHRKAIHVYNSLRRKHRVDFFVGLTKAYWDKDLVRYPDIDLIDKNTSSNQNAVMDSGFSVPKVAHEECNLSGEQKSVDKSKKRNPLFG